MQFCFRNAATGEIWCEATQVFVMWYADWSYYYTHLTSHTEHCSRGLRTFYLIFACALFQLYRAVVDIYLPHGSIFILQGRGEQKKNADIPALSENGNV
jgi:hypothetical protein